MACFNIICIHRRWSSKVLEEQGPGRENHLTEMPAKRVRRARLGILIIDLVCGEREFTQVVAAHKVAIPQLSTPFHPWEIASHRRCRSSKARCIAPCRTRSAPVALKLRRPSASGPEVHAEAVQRRGGTRLDLVAIDPGDVELPGRLPDHLAVKPTITTLRHLIVQVPHDSGQVRHLQRGLKREFRGSGRLRWSRNPHQWTLHDRRRR